MPLFFLSKWFIPETDNWHLKEGAPAEIVNEFNTWMKERENVKKQGTIID